MHYSIVGVVQMYLYHGLNINVRLIKNMNNVAMLFIHEELRHCMVVRLFTYSYLHTVLLSNVDATPFTDHIFDVEQICTLETLRHI